MISSFSGQVLNSENAPAPSLSSQLSCPWCKGTGKCPQCGGTGRDPKSPPWGRLGYECPVCKGKGRIKTAFFPEVCVRCLGRGYIAGSRCVCQDGRCPACEGSGFMVNSV